MVLNHHSNLSNFVYKDHIYLAKIKVHVGDLGAFFRFLTVCHAYITHK